MIDISPLEIDRVADLVRNGGVIIFPTETSYGIGCDARNLAAVERVIAAKGRSEDKGLPLLLPPSADPNMYGEFSVLARALATKYWPGPLNIVVPRAHVSPVSPLCQSGGTQSMRKSSHPFAATLSAEIGVPLVATSANASGQPAAYTVQAVRAYFANNPHVDAFIDAGDLPLVAPSTTIAVNDAVATVLRQGGLAVDV